MESAWIFMSNDFQIKKLQYRYCDAFPLKSHTFNAKRRHKKSLGNSLSQIENQNINKYIYVRKQTATVSSNFYQIYLGIWLFFSFSPFGQFGRIGRWVVAFTHSLSSTCNCYSIAVFLWLSLDSFLFVLFPTFKKLQLAKQLLFIGFISCCCIRY